MEHDYLEEEGVMPEHVPTEFDELVAKGCTHARTLFAVAQAEKRLQSAGSHSSECLARMQQSFEEKKSQKMEMEQRFERERKAFQREWTRNLKNAVQENNKAKALLGIAQRKLNGERARQALEVLGSVSQSSESVQKKTQMAGKLAWKIRAEVVALVGGMNRFSKWSG